MAMTREQMTALIVVDPDRARAAIRKAMRQAGTLRHEAAKVLGCGRVTFARWVDRLEMVQELDELESMAREQGWHHGRTGGYPLGRPRGPRSKRKAA